MKTTCTRALIMGLFFAIVIISCKKSDVSNQATPKQENVEATETYKPGVLLENGSILTGGVTLTAPAQVNINESFDIDATIDCGRVSIERGYILASDGITKIYKGLSCATNDLQWESIVNFQCYTTDASWTGLFTELGTYVFRTKHNSSDGNCDGLGGQNRSGECSFNGNEFYCFVIEAVNPNKCVTEFTGVKDLCSGEDRQATYTFTSEEDLSYIKIQGGLTNFMLGTTAEVTVSDPALTVSQGTPGGSSNRVITVEGSVSACETITITIKWKSTNSGGVITGSWSVKDGNGDVAAPVAGLTCQ